MIKALITQREQFNQYGDLIESLESNYIKFFENLDFEIYPISNFTKNIKYMVKNNHWDMVILTGGGVVEKEFYNYENNESQQIERNNVENELLMLCDELNIPVIGICRGMHKINTYYGGKISSFEKNIKPRIIGENHPVEFLKTKKIYFVNNYHRDGIFFQDLAENLYPLVIDKENKTIEAYTDGKRIIGVQWHPERLKNDKLFECLLTYIQ